HKIERPVILGAPIPFIDAPDRRIDYHHASRPKNRGHPPVGEPDVSVSETHGRLKFHSREVTHIIRLRAQQPGAVGAGSRSGQRIQGEIYRELVQMCVLGGEGCPVFKRLLERGLIPSRNFQGAEVVNCREGIQLVQAGHYIAIFDVRQAADVQNEIRPAALGCQLITGLFYLPISESERFPGLAQTQSWWIHVSPPDGEVIRNSHSIKLPLCYESRTV